MDNNSQPPVVADVINGATKKVDRVEDELLVAQRKVTTVPETNRTNRRLLANNEDLSKADQLAGPLWSPAGNN